MPRGRNTRGTRVSNSLDSGSTIDDPESTFEATLDPGDHVPIPDSDLELPPIEPPKRLSKPPKKPVQLSRYSAVKITASSLTTLHHIGAKVWDLPEIELSQEEAKKLGEATIDLLDVYGLSLMEHPKVAAWGNFLVVFGEVEGSRIVLLLNRPPKERRSKATVGEAPPMIIPEEIGEYK